MTKSIDCFSSEKKCFDKYSVAESLSSKIKDLTDDFIISTDVDDSYTEEQFNLLEDLIKYSRAPVDGETIITPHKELPMRDRFDNFTEKNKKVQLNLIKIYRSPISCIFKSHCNVKPDGSCDPLDVNFRFGLGCPMRYWKVPFNIPVSVNIGILMELQSKFRISRSKLMSVEDQEKEINSKCVYQINQLTPSSIANTTVMEEKQIYSFEIIK